MSDITPTKKYLAASVAANIFLVAFVLGRLTGPGFHHDHGPHDFPPPPPGFEHGVDSDGHGFGPPGGFEHHADGEHSHSPFMGPKELFTADELKANQEHLQKDFDQIGKLRHDFAVKLDARPVSKDDVLKHFAEIDQVMDAVRKESQQKASDKISTLSESDRHKFAKALLEHDKEHQPPAREGAPGMPPQDGNAPPPRN